MSRPSRDGGPPRWGEAGRPRNGWDCISVDDREEPDFTCELCGFEGVRFVHVMEHPAWDELLSVGCVCAGHLEEDLEWARQRERSARNLAARRRSLGRRYERAKLNYSSRSSWLLTAKGSFWRRDGSLGITIFPSRRNAGEWQAVVGEDFGSLSHSSPEDAMAAVFDYLHPFSRYIEDFNVHAGYPTLRLPST